MSKEYKSITGNIMNNIGKTTGIGGFVLVIGLPLFIALDVFFYILFILLSNKENENNDIKKEIENPNPNNYSGSWGWYEKKLAEDKEKKSQN